MTLRNSYTASQLDFAVLVGFNKKFSRKTSLVVFSIMCLKGSSDIGNQLPL